MQMAPLGGDVANDQALSVQATFADRAQELRVGCPTGENLPIPPGDELAPIPALEFGVRDSFHDNRSSHWVLTVLSISPQVRRVKINGLLRRWMSMTNDK